MQPRGGASGDAIPSLVRGLLPHEHGASRPVQEDVPRGPKA